MTREVLYSDYVYHVRPDESKIVSYEQFDTYELLVTMDDGSKELYDMTSHTTRRVRPEKNDILSMNEEEYSLEFGYRLTARLRDSSLSLEDLSEETNISIPTLYRYMSGDSIPSFYKAIKIARALGCDITEFMRIPK